MGILKHKDTWAGEHRGISFEIVRWESILDCFEANWNYYLFLPEPMFREEDRPQVFLELGEPDEKGRRFYDYMQCGLSDLDWHCGITFYEVRAAQGLSPVCVKAGCDYQHLYDEGMRYSEDLVQADARRCIDSLHERFNLLQRDPYDGKWGEPEEIAAAIDARDKAKADV